MEIEWKNEILYQDLVKWDSRLKYEAPFFNEIIKGIAKPKIRILDVSCGTGDHLVMFAKWGYEGVGIDISEKNIAAAEELSKKNKTKSKIKFIVCDMLKLEESLEGERFDFINCIGNTFSIFSPKERTLIFNQMYNLLNVGGKILFQLVNYMSHTNETEWFYKPNILRGNIDEIQYTVRIMEWKELKEKITMYVLRAQQENKEGENFILHKKRTEF
ncbi:MAG: class I SAM-dependent methyltransferase, partial [Candidatus Heimdallarchaeaceae archaeon]